MKYDKYEELLDFVTVVGPPNDKNRSYKYKSFQILRFPLAACEILSIENPTALDYFLPEKPLVVDHVITETVEVET